MINDNMPVNRSDGNSKVMDMLSSLLVMGRMDLMGRSSCLRYCQEPESFRGILSSGPYLKVDSPDHEVNAL